ncbi:MAG: arsenate reductase family protein [Flavicella sp.]
MKKIFHLKTCDTCKRILKEIPTDKLEIQELKENPINDSQLETLYSLSNSYEALFNKRAKLYKERCLKDVSLQEEDYKKLLLEHYTFLKRPLAVLEERIFIGNGKKNIEALKEALEK